MICRLLLLFHIFFTGDFVLASVVDARLSNKVVYAGEPALYFREFCEYAIGKIYKNPEGKRLIDKISSLLKESTIGAINFVDCSGSGAGTAFVHGLDFSKNPSLTEVHGNILRLDINLDDALRVAAPTARWCDQLFGISECVYDFKEVGKIGNVFRIAKMFSPFYVTIVHELIHLKHFLETLLGKNGSHVPYGEAVCITSYTQLVNHPLSVLPELIEKDFPIKREIPWDNFEERRTVVGPDIDNISELSFRLAEGLPLRYIYQGPDNYFYEEPDILFAVVQSAGILKNEVDNAVMKSIAKGYLSNQEKFSDFSRYHSLRIKLEFFADANIIREHNELVTKSKKDAAAIFLSAKRSQSKK
jgi:hypothetical protein